MDNTAELASIAAAERLLEKRPMSLPLLFEPGFAQARQPPAFAALVERLGLANYWHQSGHKPDFCLCTNMPLLCSSL